MVGKRDSSDLVAGGPFDDGRIGGDILRPTFQPPSPSSSGPTGQVVTIGDSYSSGTGIHTHGEDYDQEGGAQMAYNGTIYQFTVPDDEAACWREDDTTPGPKYASATGRDSIFLACKGAKIPHVRRQFDFLAAKHPTATMLKWENSVILLTAGGNDLRNDEGKSWPEIITKCIFELNVFRGCHDNSDNNPTNFAAIGESLSQLYQLVATTAPKALIRVLGYPKLLQPTGGKCKGVTGISEEEAQWADGQVTKLNDAIQSAVLETKAWFRQTTGGFLNIQYVDTPQYATKGACATEDDGRMINDVILKGGFPSSASLHPNQRGYDAFYVALRDSLEPFDDSFQ